MIHSRSLPLCALAGALLSCAAMAQTAKPHVRIVAPIETSHLVALAGNVNPHANAKNDRGAVSGSLPMTGMVLVLSRSPELQTAFDAYVASEYDPHSPNYHQWLTPAEVGARFGPAQTDIATITNWLASQGFTVKSVSPDRMTIRFDGTAASVQSAFHTQIHNLAVKGRMHIGNMTEPEIPAALAPVVHGIKGLNNFFPHPLHHMGHTVERDGETGKWVRQRAASPLAPRTLENASTKGQPKLNAPAAPQFGVSVGGANPYTVEDVGPWDFATIYNVTPLWSAGIDGTGQTIAIAGTSAIDIGESGTPGQPGYVAGADGNNDVATFRTFFDLPTNNSWNSPIQISGNSEPLTVCTDTTGNVPYADNSCGISDLEENSLDVEWSGAVAKNAQIILVSSYPSSESDDSLYDSESYIVDHLTAHIMNVSYGECELGMGTAGNVAYYDLWETAAAEGIAVFVASGDSGSASCDDGGDSGGSNLPYASEYGLTVSGLAATPWNTAVGGTDFDWCPLTSGDGCASEAGKYWNTSNSSTTESNVKGYVPELPWNNTCASPLALSFMTNFFSGTTYQAAKGENYSVTDAESGCNAIAYDASELENDGDGVLLYLDDTIGGSGGASGCVASSTSQTSNTFGTCSTGATSTGATTNPDTGAPQASLPLVNDGWPKPSWQAGVPGIPSDGVRDVPDVSFFASDGYLSSSAYLICVSAASQDPECSYSTSSEPFAEEVGGTSVATPAMAGVMALIDQKAGAAQGSPNGELYSLAAAQNYGNCSSESATTSDGCYFNDIDQGSNAMPCDYDLGALYEGAATTPSPNCTVAHAGDYIGILPGYSATSGYDEATGLGSLNVANVVNGWAVVLGSGKAAITVTPNPTSANTGNLVQVTITAAGAAGAPQNSDGQTITPTGTVTLTVPGTSYSAAGTLDNNGSVTITIPAGTLPGSATGQVDTLTASYAGDVNYAASTGTGQVTVSNVTLLTPTVAVTPTQTGSTIGISVSVTGSGATPTGFILLKASIGSYPATTETIGTSPCASASSCVFSIPANQLSAGPETFTAVYSGDGNYVSANGTGQITVVEPTFTLSPSNPSPSSITPGGSSTVVVTVTAQDGYTGTVSLTCNQTGGSSTGDGTTCTGGGGSTAVNLATCGSNCTVTFTIGTIAPQAAAAALNRQPAPRGGKGGWLGAGGGAVLAVLVFCGIPARRRSWRSMLSVIVVMAAIGLMSSCGGGVKTTGTGTGGSGGGSGGSGGGSGGDPGTTAGTYTYTVKAIPNPSVSPGVTTTFQVTVN